MKTLGKAGDIIQAKTGLDSIKTSNVGIQIVREPYFLAFHKLNFTPELAQVVSYQPLIHR